MAAYIQFGLPSSCRLDLRLSRCPSYPRTCQAMAYSEPFFARRICWVAAFVAVSLLHQAAWAQYKVVQPDGSITYTDRPQVTPTARVTPIGANNKTAAVGNELPPELRQAAQRYPVTLYTAKDCPACEAGRRFLQTRGIPYAERVLSTEEDAAAMERAAGGRSVPTLTIGQQPLRGWAESEWATYLDVAGYPRESKLPRNWPKTVATPVVERTVVAPERVAPVAITPTPEVLPPPPDPVNNPAGVRF
jgi:glutaredoxin